MQPQDRRCFVKRSLASSAALSAPAFFTGLIRAHGEEGETTTTGPWDTTAPGETTVETTYDPFETTVETTEQVQTTVAEPLYLVCIAAPAANEFSAESSSTAELDGIAPGKRKRTKSDKATLIGPKKGEKKELGSSGTARFELSVQVETKCSFNLWDANTGQYSTTAADQTTRKANEMIAIMGNSAGVVTPYPSVCSDNLEDESNNNSSAAFDNSSITGGCAFGTDANHDDTVVTVVAKSMTGWSGFTAGGGVGTNIQLLSSGAGFSLSGSKQMTDLVWPSQELSREWAFMVMSKSEYEAWSDPND